MSRLFVEKQICLPSSMRHSSPMAKEPRTSTAMSLWLVNYVYANESYQRVCGQPWLSPVSRCVLALIPWAVRQKINCSCLWITITKVFSSCKLCQCKWVLFIPNPTNKSFDGHSCHLSPIVYLLVSLCRAKVKIFNCNCSCNTQGATQVKLSPSD